MAKLSTVMEAMREERKIKYKVLYKYKVLHLVYLLLECIVRGVVNFFRNVATRVVQLILCWGSCSQPSKQANVAW